jgi:hypothetical protein
MNLMRRLLRGIRVFWGELTEVRRTSGSVRGKLMSVVSLTTVIALLVAGSALLWHDRLPALLDLGPDHRSQHSVDFHGAGAGI